MDYKYIQVLVDVPLGTRTFSYTIPQTLKEKVKIGQALSVPFGKRTIKAYCVGFSNYLEEGIKARDIIKILDEIPVFTLEYLKLLEWVSEYYYCDLQTVLKTAIPKDFFENVNSKTQNWLIYKNSENTTPRQKKVLEILQNSGEMLLCEFIDAAKTTYTTVKKLAQMKCIEVDQREVFRNPNNIFKKEDTKEYTLSEEQNEVYQKIKNKTDSEAALIHGVTGSGKTEIYFKLIEDCVLKGKNVLFLAPEIALVSQLTMRSINRFGSDSVSIWHSSISEGERFDVWQKLRENKIKILMGARSAVFAPLSNIGLIIIDEEYDPSFKQSMPNPRYDARSVAKKLAEFHGAKLVLGSATPDIAAYYRAKNTNSVYELNIRYNRQKLPDVSIIDMKEEKKDANSGLFSRALVKNIELNLKNKKQTILLINRRGYSTYTQCMECGEVILCDKCAIPMIFHASKNSHKCHWCNSEIFNVQKCPSCSSPTIKNFGVGAQRIEDVAKKIFPEANIVRLDSDALTQKNKHIEILNDFKMGKIDILVGTQMIAKGLDNPNVTLVGVMNADLSFNLPDFRSCERGFSLLTQVAGRAGRAQDKGKVLFQTYNGEFEPLINAKEQDYKLFYENEIKSREDYDYPPFSQLIRLIISSKNQFRAEHAALEISNRLQEVVEKKGISERLIVFDSAPCIFEKIKNEYRFNILIKNKLEDRGHKLITTFLRSIVLPNDIKMIVDVDPVDIL